MDYDIFFSLIEIISVILLYSDLFLANMHGGRAMDTSGKRDLFGVAEAQDTLEDKLLKLWLPGDFTIAASVDHAALVLLQALRELGLDREQLPEFLVLVVS